jgi:hypothetical protein
VSAINLLDTFCDIHEGKREVLFFYFDPDTSRDKIYYNISIFFSKTSVIIIISYVIILHSTHECACDVHVCESVNTIIIYYTIAGKGMHVSYTNELTEEVLA